MNEDSSFRPIADAASPSNDEIMSICEDEDVFETLRAEGTQNELEISTGGEPYIDDTEGQGKVAEFEARPEETESSENMVFHPPVYIQRYLAVCDVLNSLIKEEGSNNPKSILEVGCAEFKMLTYLKHMPTIEKITFMDIDEVLLDDRKYLLRPLPMEHIMKRETPLTVEAYAGSIVKVDQKVLDLEPKLFSIIAIEVVEHLHEDVLEGFEKSVFGVIKPPIVIVTTPNSDFNVLFDLAPGKFRHWDHKFEWSRAEFDEWCKKICLQYPYYTYSVDGIGSVPESVDLGCVSQIAVFKKQSIAASNDCTSVTSLSGIIEDGAYKLLASIDFPFFKDTTPDDERVLKELQYYLNCYVFNKASLENYEDEGLTQIRFPLQAIQSFNRMPSSVQDISFLRTILEKGGYEVEEDIEGNLSAIVPIPIYEDDVERSDDEEEAQFSVDYESICESTRQVSVEDTTNDKYEDESWE